MIQSIQPENKNINTFIMSTLCFCKDAHLCNRFAKTQKASANTDFKWGIKVMLSLKWNNGKLNSILPKLKKLTLEHQSALVNDHKETLSTVIEDNTYLRLKKDVVVQTLTCLPLISSYQPEIWNKVIKVSPGTLSDSRITAIISNNKTFSHIFVPLGSLFQISFIVINECEPGVSVCLFDEIHLYNPSHVTQILKKGSFLFWKWKLSQYTWRSEEAGWFYLCWHPLRGDWDNKLLDRIHIPSSFSLK